MVGAKIVKGHQHRNHHDDEITITNTILLTPLQMFHIGWSKIVKGHHNHYDDDHDDYYQLLLSIPPLQTLHWLEQKL